MMPDQRPKIYLEGTQKVHDLLVLLSSAVRDGFRDFWANPPAQAFPLNLQSRAAGMTAQQVFDMHALIIQALAGIIPQRLAWFGSGPPFHMPFLPNGDIDVEALTAAWALHLASLPDPEPEVQ
jgi:hypothetical protein